MSAYKDESGRVFDVKINWEFICPFCDGRVIYGEEKSAGPLLLHTSPHCETFDRLDITSFARAARLAGARILS